VAERKRKKSRGAVKRVSRIQEKRRLREVVTHSRCGSEKEDETKGNAGRK